jgi:mycothiol synthase
MTTTTPLPEGFHARALTLDDVEEFVALANRYWEPLLGIAKFIPDDMRRIFSMPGFDPATSTHTVIAPDGPLAGCMIVMDVADPPVHPEAMGCVDAAFERRGLGTHLLAWADARARRAIARVPDGARVALHALASGAHAPTVQLLARQGFTAIRGSLLMVIDLTAPPPVPEWPAGLVLCTFQDRPDVRATYRAVADSFQDHWGYVKRDEDQAIQRWQHRFEHDPNFDPTLWLLLMDGEEIAALALCDPSVGEDRSMGFVTTLGVLRAGRELGTESLPGEAA